MSIPRRTEIALAAALALAASACTDEQSREIGRIPKKTIDKTRADIDQAMKQGAERLKEDDR